MNTSEIGQTEGLTRSGIALVGTQFFYLIFGGFLIGKDLYEYLDPESALSVLLIYSIIAICASLFLLGKRYGLFGLFALSIILIMSQSIYIVVYLSQTTIDPSLHDPLANLWLMLLNYLFPILTLILSIRVYRET